MSPGEGAGTGEPAGAGSRPGGRGSPVLRAVAIGKSYWGKKVLTSAGLWAHRGRVTALVGRNGAGKTTLLELAAGLRWLDHGTVTFRGEHYLRPRLARLARRGLFYLPARGLLGGGRPLRWYLSTAADRFGSGGWREAAALLELGELLERDPDGLSGGERRRAELAVAAARGPACLLADEPFRGIAPSDAETVAAALERLAEGGCAVVVTGHRVERVFAVSQAVVWLTAGTTHWLGTPEEARSRPEFVRRYLGPARIGDDTRKGGGRWDA